MATKMATELQLVSSQPNCIERGAKQTAARSLNPPAALEKKIVEFRSNDERIVCCACEIPKDCFFLVSLVCTVNSAAYHSLAISIDKYDCLHIGYAREIFLDRRQHGPSFLAKRKRARVRGDAGAAGVLVEKDLHELILRSPASTE